MTKPSSINNAVVLTHHFQRLQALCELWQSAERDVWVTLQGCSMMPTILPGSRLRLRCRSQEPALGDVVAFRRENRLIIHRLMHVTEDEEFGRQLICKGDGNSEPDAPITPDEIVGVVIQIQPPRLQERAWQMMKHFLRRGRKAVRQVWTRFTPRTLKEKTRC